MELAPDVSVIIPVYNAERYLRVCLDSLIKQTFQSFEVILVDDGSTDGSLSICNEYAGKDARFKVLAQQNSGVSCARNNGINHACGRYIAFLDADDFWDDGFLKTMLDFQSQNIFAICRIMRTDVNGSPMHTFSINRKNDGWCWPIFSNMPVSCCEGLFDRGKINKYGIRFEEGLRTGEDQEFTYKYMMLCDDVAVAENAIYYYRINPDSAMFKNDHSHFDALKAFDGVIKFASENLNKERCVLLASAIKNIRCPATLEFATVNLFVGGERYIKVKKYLDANGYSKMLDDAVNSDDHYDSKFMRLWKISPALCLHYFHLVRTVGRALRKMGLKK